MSAGEGRWSGVVVVAVALLALATASLSRRQLASEEQVELALHCVGDRCRAEIDGGEPIVVDYPKGAGERLGPYLFQLRASERGTSFQQLSVRRLQTDTPSSVTLRLASRDVALSPFEAVDGWQIVPVRGLSYRGEMRRAITLLEDFRASSFRLRATLQRPHDAGFLVRATDRRSGLVFVVRQRHNDAFFFELVDGQPGPILAFGPYRELTWEVEAVRVAGILAEIVLAASVLVLAWRLLRQSGWARRPFVLLSGPIAWLRPRLTLSGRGVWPLVAAVSLAGFAATAAVATHALDGVPHLADETAYLFQAKLFAQGRLWAPAPLAPEFFAHEHLIVSGGRWFSKYPPMLSALLAVGVRLGAPELVNPALAGVLAGVLFLLVRRIASTAAAVIASALLLTSPFYLLMGGNLMSHTAAALFTAIAVWCAVEGCRRELPRWLLATGLAWGGALLTRPFTAAMIALPIAAYVLLDWPATRRHALLRGVGFGLLGALPGILLLLGWMIVLSPDGSSLDSTYTSYDASDSLGFGPDKGRGWLMTWGSWGHTPGKALRSVSAYLGHTSQHLLGWPWRWSLCLLPVPFLLGRARAVHGLFLAILALLAGGHTLYWATQHLGYGARYWFSAVPGLVALAAIAIERLRRGLAPAGGGVSYGSAAVLTGVAGLVAWNLFSYLPHELAHGHDYGGVTADLKREASRRGLDDAVVFVATEGLLFNDGLYLNDPLLTDGPIYARDLGPDRRQELRRLYPDRRAYLWDKRELVELATLTTSVAAQPASFQSGASIE